MNQTTKWYSESERYVKKFLNDENVYYKKYFNLFKNSKITNVLDVGCGNGNALNYLINKNKNLKNGIGIEPSKKAVQLLNKKYKRKKLKFISAFNHNLPFKDNEFDLVISWGVLSWIDRNNYLQSLGELCRVTNKYLFIFDFYSINNFYTDYKHKKDFKTFRVDSSKIILQTGKFKVTKEVLILGDHFGGKKTNINKLKKNFYLNKYSRKISIFKKLKSNVFGFKKIIL